MEGNFTYTKETGLKSEIIMWNISDVSGAQSKTVNTSSDYYKNSRTTGVFYFDKTAL